MFRERPLLSKGRMLPRISGNILSLLLKDESLTNKVRLILIYLLLAKVRNRLIVVHCAQLIDKLPGLSHLKEVLVVLLG